MKHEYMNEYKREHYKQLILYLNYEKDQDLIDYLSVQDSKNETIKTALREHMKGDK